MNQRTIIKNMKKKNAESSITKKNMISISQSHQQQKEEII